MSENDAPDLSDPRPCPIDVPCGYYWPGHHMHVIHANKVGSVRIHANADGVRGSGKRVFRTFPVIPVWSGVLDVMISDPDLPDAVFERVVIAAGRCQGVGRFRPEKGGSNGRFTVTKFEWAVL